MRLLLPRVEYFPEVCRWKAVDLGFKLRGASFDQSLQSLIALGDVLP